MALYVWVVEKGVEESTVKARKIFLGLFSLPSDFWLLLNMEKNPCLSYGLINLEWNWVGGEKNLKMRETQVCGAAQFISD